jgi:hypothetical protein
MLQAAELVYVDNPECIAQELQKAVPTVKQVKGDVFHFTTRFGDQMQPGHSLAGGQQAGVVFALTVASGVSC